VVVSLLAGVFPVFLLLADRRKGELIPGVVYKFLGHPLLVVSVYLIALGSVLLHGLVIWEAPLLRVGATCAAMLMLVMGVLLFRSKAFSSRDALLQGCRRDLA
jgi:hypothetical protein